MAFDEILKAIRAQTKATPAPVADDVLTVEVVETAPPPCEPVATRREPVDEVASSASLPAGAIPNPGMLMTLGARYGYPRLPLKQAVAIAAGYTAWRAFTRGARTDMLWLAFRAACSTWPAEPMINDLLYREPTEEPAPAPPIPVSAGPFVPSSEWQTIPDGYPCPPGGEFKMNLQTGVNMGRWPTVAGAEE